MDCCYDNVDVDMENNMKLIEFIIKAILFAILIFSFVYILGFADIRQHEYIHKEIYEDYGINSTVEINYITLTGVTTTEGDYESCNDFCYLQHNLNEIIGYNMTILIFTLWFIFLAHVCFKLLFYDIKK